MNTARLNFTRLNTSVLNASLLNSSLMGGRGKGSSSRPSGLIAQYKPYLNSNDSPTRDVLKDYSGHGNDVVLHNFAFSGMSGYGGYPVDSVSKSSSGDNNALISKWSVKATDTGYTGMRVATLSSNSNVLYFKVNVEGNKPDYNLKAYYYYKGESIELDTIDGDGEFEYTVNPIDDPDNNIVVYVACRTSAKGYDDMNLIITLLPNYPGALVSDGVDDYGICENFPILAKEKGYTVVAFRKWLDKEKDQVLLFKLNDDNHGAFLFECIEANSHRIYSYGAITFINSFPDLFSFQKKNKYNTNSIGVGNNQDGSTLSLFRGRYGYYYYSNIALYSLEIYNRDLTEEEIDTVKQRMIAEYEKATGNVMEGVILLEDGTDLLLEDGTSLLME